MAEVLDFPSRESRAYAFLEEQLSELLTERGADAPLIAYASRALREVYSELADSGEHGFSVNLPAATTVAEAAQLQQQIGEGIDTLRQQHHDAMLKLAARLLLAELQLFQHRRQDDSDE